MDKNHHEELFDSHIKYAGKEMLIKLSKTTPSEEELANFKIPSKNIDKRIQASINKEVRKKHIKRALKVSARIAAVLSIFVIVSSVALVSSEALRVRFFDLFKTSDNVSTNIIINDSNEPGDAISPGYLPEGYYFAGGTSNKIIVESIYENSAGNTIIISQRKSMDAISYDNERSTSYETKIDGNRAIVVENPDDNIIFYFGELYIYKVFGNIEVDQLIYIIKSLPK